MQPSSGNSATFHEPAHLESAPQPPPALRQIAAELSGRLAGQSPNISIEFVLMLENTAAQEIRILDPLDSFRLQLTTTGGRLIPLPERPPKNLPKVALPKDATPGMRRDAPYPAAVQFRQIVSGRGVSYQKEETLTIPPGGKVRIVFDTEPVVMERVMETLRSEKGEAVRSFKARATMGLLSAPPQAGVGGQLLDSDWIFFTIPPG